MKKATITFITSAALAFAMPLFAADEPVLKSDSQLKAGVTQQEMKSDSQPQAGVSQPGMMKSDSQSQAGVTQPGMMKSDSQSQAGVTQPDMKSDSQSQAGVTQPGMKSDSQSQAGVTQPDMKSDSQQKAGLAQQSGQTITAKELKGMEVVTQNGEELGEIDKITINKESGEVQYVTFSRGGILGIGGEKIAVPLSAFEIRDDKATLTIDQSKLDNVPQQNAEVTDSDYLRDLETHYGVAPAWEGNRGDTTKTQPMDQNSTEPRKIGTKN